MASYRFYLSDEAERTGPFQKSGGLVTYRGVVVDKDQGAIYFEIEPGESVPEHLNPYVTKFTVHDIVTSTTRRSRGVYKSNGAYVTLDYRDGKSTEPYLIKGSATVTFEGLVELYEKIRAGTIEPDISYEQAPSATTRIVELEKERDNALLQLGRLVNEKDKGDENFRTELAKLDGEKQGLEIELRLMRERVTALLSNIWCDMFKVRWWEGKNALRLVIAWNIRAEPFLANLMSEEDGQSIRAFTR